MQKYWYLSWLACLATQGNIRSWWSRNCLGLLRVSDLYKSPHSFRHALWGLEHKASSRTNALLWFFVPRIVRQGAESLLSCKYTSLIIFAAHCETRSEKALVVRMHFFILFAAHCEDRYRMLPFVQMHFFWFFAPRIVRQGAENFFSREHAFVLFFAPRTVRIDAESFRSWMSISQILDATNCEALGSRFRDWGPGAESYLSCSCISVHSVNFLTPERTGGARFDWLNVYHGSVSLFPP